METPRLHASTSPPSGSRDDGDEVRLTPTEWAIVEPLVRNPGKLVTQRQLLQEVWGPQYESETNYLRVYLAQIRRKLEPDPARRGTSSPSRGWATASSSPLRAPRASRAKACDARLPRQRTIGGGPVERLGGPAYGVGGVPKSLGRRLRPARSSNEPDVRARA